MNTRKYGISLSSNESWTTFGALPYGAVFWDATHSEYLVRKIGDDEGRYLDDCGIVGFSPNDDVVITS